MDVDVLIRVDDPTVDGEELQQIVRVVAAELEEQGAIVALAGTEGEPTIGVPKGEPGSGNLLDVKINLDTLKSVGKWFYDRLIGAGTEAEFEYEGVKFKFKGRNEQDREAAMQDFERFVATIAAAKRKD